MIDRNKNQDNKHALLGFVALSISPLLAVIGYFLAYLVGGWMLVGSLVCLTGSEGIRQYMEDIFKK